MISFSGSHLFFICRLRGWMNPALPYARVIPPAVPRTRSPPPSFHYTVRSRASLDYGRCVKSAGDSRAATHKGRALSANNKLPCHTSNSSSRSLSQSSTAKRRPPPSSIGFQKRFWRAIATASSPGRRARQLSARARAASLYRRKPNSRRA